MPQLLQTWRRQRAQAGAQLRAVREAAGLTQLDLAAMSGITHEAISRLEHGNHAPRADTLRRLARALGVAPAALVAPLATAEAGGAPAVGDVGVRVSDGVRLQCHLCGDWYVNLGGHVAQKHGLTAAEYKARFSLKAGPGLIGPDLLATRQAHARARIGTPVFDRFRAAAAAHHDRTDGAPRQGRPVSLEARLDPARQAASQANLAKAHAVLAARRAAGTYQEPGFADQAAVVAKAHARLAQLRADPAWHAAWRAQLSASRGGRLQVSCVVCGTTFTEPHSKRTRKTCGPACRTAHQQQQASARRAERAAWGAQLRAQRQAAHLSQAQLAVRLGVSASLVAQWERGRCHPTPAMQATLRRLLGEA